MTNSGWPTPAGGAARPASVQPSPAPAGSPAAGRGPLLGLLLGALAIAIVAVLGVCAAVFGWFGGDRPRETAERFLESAIARDWAAVDGLVHEDSKLRDGSRTAGPEQLAGAIAGSAALAEATGLSVMRGELELLEASSASGDASFATELTYRLQIDGTERTIVQPIEILVTSQDGSPAIWHLEANGDWTSDYAASGPGAPSCTATFQTFGNTFNLYGGGGQPPSDCLSDGAPIAEAVAAELAKPHARREFDLPDPELESLRLTNDPSADDGPGLVTWRAIHADLAYDVLIAGTSDGSGRIVAVTPA